MLNLNYKINYFNKYVAKNLSNLFWLSALFILVFMLSVSNQFGICWDEKFMMAYGEGVYNFFSSGFKKLDYFNDFDGGKISNFNDSNELTNTYGGLFDLISRILFKLSGKDQFFVNHLLISFFGFLAILYTGLTARLLNGNRAGLFAIWFIFLSPVFLGHSMFNPKDIPLATGYIIAIFCLIKFLKEFPMATFKTSLYLCLSIGFVINLRIGGLIVIPYLLVFLIIKIFLNLNYENIIFKSELIGLKKPILFVFIIIILGYFLGLLFWPYALLDPIHHPLLALKNSTNFSRHDSYGLFDGNWIHKWEIPWYYLPVWIAITNPLYVIIIILILPLLIFYRLLTLETDVEYNQVKTSFKQKIFNSLIYKERWLIFLLFTSLFPIIYIIIKKSNVYDGWRHVLFTYPPLVAFCSIIWCRLITFSKSISQKFHVIIWAILAYLVFDPVIFIIKNHPFESFYFNQTVGGIGGAFKKYEIDYYGTSIKQAVEWISENTETKTNIPFNIRCYYGENISCEYFVKKYSHLKYVRTIEDSPDWDFSIILPVQAKLDKNLLENWPPKNLVYEKEIDGTPIFAIIKNPLDKNDPLLKEKSIKDKMVSKLINESLDLFSKKDYFGCIKKCENVIAIDSNNVIAYNNMGTAYNYLKKYKNAKIVLEKALKINPHFTLAINNLKIAVDNIK